MGLEKKPTRIPQDEVSYLEEEKIQSYSKIGAGPHNQMTKLHTLENTPVIQEDRDQDGVCQTNKRKVYELSFPIYLVVQDVYIDMFLDSGNVLCILEYL